MPPSTPHPQTPLLDQVLGRIHGFVNERRQGDVIRLPASVPFESPGSLNLCDDHALVNSLRRSKQPVTPTTFADLLERYDVLAVGEYHDHPFGLYDVFTAQLASMKAAGLTHLALGETREATQGTALKEFLNSGT